MPGNAPPQETTLTHYITHHLICCHAEFDLPDDFFVQLLKEGRNVVLLLDGLDEVADEDERAQVRQSVEELVSGRPALRVIVTCRTIAYRSGRTALGADFREIAVQPLDPELHIAPMVRQAYACIHPHDATLRDKRAEDLLRGILALEETRRARLGKDADALVDSPLMVRLLLIVHVNERTLPDERAVLFEKAINALLQVDYGREENNNSDLAKDWKPYRDMAQHLAFHMHRQGSDQGREIEEAALKRALREEETFVARIDDFLSHARQRGSVLEERNGVYRFIHLAFQEFLVARYLREVIGGAGRAAILAQIGALLDDPWWREPLLLLGGYWAAHSSQAAREFLGELAQAGSTPDTRFSAAELAGTAVLEWRDSGATIREGCAQRIVTLLGDGTALQGSKPVIRARAGDVLAALGDPRFDPRCCHLPGDDMLGFARIPADPDFCIGTRKKDAQRLGVRKYEINDEPTPTRDFYLACYPVTVAQFREFVGTTKFKLENDDALRTPDNRPVKYVSWHDALAYCDWLNARLAALPDNRIAQLIRDGWRIGLPSELEWEKAARGGSRDQAYPWGDEPDANRANYSDTGIDATSAVGCFPANGYGLHDMSGNVWEWTRSLWGKDSQKPEFAYPYGPEDQRREDMDAGDDVYRVVRGGGWADLPDGARCACRNWSRPGLRYYLLGFRVVLRSSPVFPLCPR
ncbi:MAG: SUMF1/EgtB/PvdO family nonheme iron enzyme [Sulfuricellaceae bacterium]